MKTATRITLDARMAHLSIGFDMHFGHSVHARCALVQADMVFHEVALRPVLSNNQHARVAGKPLTGSDKEQMARGELRLIARDVQHRAVM